MPITGLDDDLRVLVADMVETAATALLSDLVEAAPVGATGELRDSAYGPDLTDDGTVYTATLGFSAPQADWTDQGVGPHDIDGNPLLAFQWDNAPGGATFFIGPHVNHPGQEGTGWFSDLTDDESWETYVDDAAAALP